MWGGNKMKKTIISLLVFLLAVSSVLGSVETTFRCDGGKCVQGEEMDWQVKIYNNLDEEITIGRIWIKDRDTRQLIALHNSEDVLLELEDSHTFRFQNLIPAPFGGGDTFEFETCFNVITGELVEPICSQDTNTLKVVTLLGGVCLDDIDCSSNSQCIDEGCVQLVCAEDQVVVEHECVSLNCEWHEKAESGSCVAHTMLFTVILLTLLAVIVIVVVSVFAFKPKKRKRKKKK